VKSVIRRKKTDEISSKEYIFDTQLDKILNDKEKLDCDGEVTDTEFSEAIGNKSMNYFFHPILPILLSTKFEPLLTFGYKFVLVLSQYH
jgi:hypothetical protein